MNIKHQSINKMENQKLDIWAIVELFGHSKICGKITEQSIAGGNMLRVDVPETTSQPAFTKFYGNAAIYCINPVGEDVAKYMADKLSITPINSWDMSAAVKKMNLISSPAQHAEGNGDEEYKGFHDF